MKPFALVIALAVCCALSYVVGYEQQTSALRSLRSQYHDLNSKHSQCELTMELSNGNAKRISEHNDELRAALRDEHQKCEAIIAQYKALATSALSAQPTRVPTVELPRDTEWSRQNDLLEREIRRREINDINRILK